MRRAVLLLCLAQAACFIPVRERYRVEGPPEVLLATARDNANRLGWETADGADGGFIINDYPGRRRGESLEVNAKDGTLTIDGNGVEGAPSKGDEIEFRLAESAEILARTTDAQLHQLQGGEPVTTRSRPVAVALDLLLPAAGAWYSMGGDPYRDAPAASGKRIFWWEFAMRAGLDTLAGGLAAEWFYFDKVEHRSIGAFSLLTPIVMAVVVRAMSVFMDWSEIGYRNAYAASGLPSPSDSYRPDVEYSMRH